MHFRQKIVLHELFIPHLINLTFLSKFFKMMLSKTIITNLRKIATFNENFIPAIITEITDSCSATPVKILKLKPEKALKYLPGQWLDFDSLVPESRLLGLSMINYNSSCIEVAAKISDHPTVEWIHKTAQVNDQIAIQIGDDLTLSLDEQIIKNNQQNGLVLRILFFY